MLCFSYWFAGARDTIVERLPTKTCVAVTGGAEMAFYVSSLFLLSKTPAYK